MPHWCHRVAAWAFPGTMIFSWVIWPTLDRDWLQEIGLVADPDAGMLSVQAATKARMEARMATVAAAKMEKEGAVEEEEEEAAPEDAAKEDVAPADEGEEEEEQEEEDEEKEKEEESLELKPLYDPVKGDNLTREEMWDNYTLKATRLDDDDDDDDEEDDDDGTYWRL